jgi:hypothetical protein
MPKAEKRIGRATKPEAVHTMVHSLKPFTTLTDFITGREVPNIGAEENRQAVERYLVEQKSYDREDIQVDVPIEMDIAGEIYRSAVDLVVGIGQLPLMVLKCAAGSLVSYEREILAAARLLDRRPIPWAVASDGRTAVVLDTISGRRIGQTLDAIPSKAALSAQLTAFTCEALSPERRLREALIFRTYDRESVNRSRRMPGG